MAGTLNIRCKDLGVEHDGFVTGRSIDDLIDCVIRTIAEETGASIAELSVTDNRDLIRSVLLQSARPESKRSATLASLIA